MTLALSIFLRLVAQTSDSLDYGDVYLADIKEREASRFQFQIGYGSNISNSFISVDSLMGAGQVRVWKYFSTGVFGLINRFDLSSAGTQIRNLEALDLHAAIPAPRWGIFSLSSLQFMLGKWNVLNLGTLESELVFGGGFGTINRGKDINGSVENKLSYLWNAEHRFHLTENLGLFISILGHLDTSYLESGIHLRFH